MKNRIVVNKEFIIGKIEKDLWGSFVEHMGRSVYGGIYEPAHEHSDEDGFRTDVMDAVKELGVPLIRYPGGNFLSGYNWRDGVGKIRPVKLDLAWGQTEPNEVGLHEFCGWAEKVGAEVMLSVNLGTGTPASAAELVEYCNYGGATSLSDERRANGREKPFGIKKWCLGNEMDGEWQICAMTAEEYGRKAAETAKMMKWADENIRLVACGSSASELKTYPEWDRVILQHTYDYVDYLSLHRYYSYTPSGRTTDFMSAHVDLDASIKAVAATVDYVRAYKRSKKEVKLSLDEWNIWHKTPEGANENVYNDTYSDRWKIGPRRVENVYDLADAIAFAGLICAVINNADRVEIGCLAQLVNVIAPIYTENKGRMVKQSIYYEYFRMYVYTGDEIYLDAARFLQANTKLSTDYKGELGWKYRAIGPEASNVAGFAFRTVGVWLPWSGIANIEPIAYMEETFGNTDVNKTTTDRIVLATALQRYGAGGKLKR